MVLAFKGNNFGSCIDNIIRIKYYLYYGCKNNRSRGSIMAERGIKFLKYKVLLQYQEIYFCYDYFIDKNILMYSCTVMKFFLKSI